jgi:type II secretory pathway component PulF
MPAYAFTARSREGKALKGIRAAANEAALASELAAESAFLISAKAAGGDAKAKGGGSLKLKRKELAAFLLHLASYVEAGVPLLSALQDYRVEENPALDAAIQDLRRRIEGGSSLSESMEAYPSLFNHLQVSMIRAGENSGRLDEALQEVIRLVEWEDRFQAQVKQASTYPLIVLGLIGLVILVVSIFALPAIMKLLRDFNVPLPLITRIFMGVGDFLVHYGWVLVLAPTAVYFGLKAALRDPAFRLAWDTHALGLPVVGPLVTKLGLSRFSRFFAAQYRAGIPVIQVLRDCEAITGNARLGLCVRQIREGVERGERLGVMAAQVGYFPKLVIRMLAIGEEAGNLEQTLGKVSTYFDAEVDASIKRVFQLLEPMLMVFLASILIFVAIAILLPIYTLIGGVNASAR